MVGGGMSEYTITMTVQADKDGGVNIGRIERILRAAGLDARVGRQVFQGTPLLHAGKPRIVVDCSCCDDTDCDCPCSTDENCRRYEFHCHAYDCDNDQTVIRDPDTGEPVDGYEHALAVLVEDFGWQIGDKGVQRGRTYCPKHRIEEAL
jgi:hypothetical protein